MEWALSRGIETATFHIMTPYPGTRLEARLAAEGRLTSRDWDLYDTRHAVFTPAGMTAEQLETGYWGAYREFYRWRNILRASFAHGDAREHLRHLAYTAGLEEARADVGPGRSAAARCTASCRCSRRSSTASAAAAGRCRAGSGLRGPAAGRPPAGGAGRPGGRGPQANGWSFSELPRPCCLNCERHPQLAMKR